MLQLFLIADIATYILQFTSSYIVLTYAYPYIHLTFSSYNPGQITIKLPLSPNVRETFPRAQLTQFSKNGRVSWATSQAHCPSAVSLQRVRSQPSSTLPETFQGRHIPYNSIQVLVTIIKTLFNEKNLHFPLFFLDMQKIKINAVSKFTKLRRFVAYIHFCGYLRESVY